MPQKPFKGIIKLDVRDSVADWDALPAGQGAGGRTEHSVRAVRRHRPGRVVALRRRHQHADAAETGRQRPAVFAVAHHGAVLADALDAADRPQPSPERHGRDHRGRERFPGCERTHPARVRDDGADPPGQRLEHLLARQGPQRAGDRTSPRARRASSGRCNRASIASTASSAARPTAGIPDLVDDNKFIDQPYSPEEGYHLSKDLADQALRMLRDHKATNPSRPWYMWFCPGANHAPHHCPQEYIDKYKGKFDDGYEAYREWVLPRMIEKGILPKGTELTPLNPLPDDVSNAARHGASVGHAQRRREEAVLAPDGGLRRASPNTPTRRSAGSSTTSNRPASSTTRSSSTRGQRRVGRRQSERIGQREQVLQRLSGRTGGEPEADRSARQPGHLRALSDRLGGGDVDAVQDVQALLGIRRRHLRPAGDLLAEGDQGARRSPQSVSPQHRHRPDASSTSAAWRCRRCTAASSSTRSRACRCATASTSPTAPTQKKRQYYAMLGTRGIWEDGWKAVALHAPISGKGHLDKDVWELYHVDVDPAESKNLAKEHPDKLKALIAAWFEEADKNLVLPIDDRTALDQLNIERPSDEPARDRYVYSPGTSPVPEGVAVNVRGRSYKILADVEITDPNCSGVIFAHGSRFGGHSLFIKDKKLYYVYNFLGIPPEQQFMSARAEAREVHARHGVHAREGRPVPRIHRHDQTLRQRQSRDRGPDARAGRQIHAVGRRPVRRPRQR